MKKSEKILLTVASLAALGLLFYVAKKAKKEKIDETITKEYELLLAAVQKSEEILLEKNQKEIKRMLLDEIIKRYQYKQGLYEYYTTNNSEIARATALLANQNEYDTILK